MQIPLFCQVVTINMIGITMFFDDEELYDLVIDDASSEKISFVAEHGQS